MLLAPDISDQTFHVTVEREMQASPSAIYAAWTTGVDTWFAEPGRVRMRAEVGEPFVFQTRHEGKIYSHHGRFLSLAPDRLVEMTWVTGRGGTEGAETVVRMELSPLGEGSRVRLTHSGFYTEKTADRHRDAWPHVLAHLDETIGKRGDQPA